MNKEQKQVLQSQLESEADVLEKLKKIYKKSLSDIDTRIAALLGRKDTENLQSIIYQVDYQNALKAQINGILDDLNGNQFTTISEYLSKCYEDGFIGTMYDLQKQGIPFIFPIDQNQVVRAIQHDTKLSTSLYNKLGEDVNILKTRIANNISRGIAQNSSYADISKNIAVGMVGDYSKMRGGALGKAYTITRTEGHRITQEATHDAQKKAKEKGADVVKQWDSTLDKRTRPHHAQLDGQIRELDEEFEVAGRKALYPGGFGVPGEDIHCRCVVLQRARIALDEEELKTLEERAAYYGLDKADSFEDFKKKYIEAKKPPVITKPFEGKTYSMNPDGTLSQWENDYSDGYEIDFTSDKILTAEEAAKLTPDQLEKYDAIVNGDKISILHPEKLNQTKAGTKYNEITYTLNPDGTYSAGAVKNEAQYKIGVDNNKVLNVDVTKQFDNQDFVDMFANSGDVAQYDVIYDALPDDLKTDFDNMYNAYGGAAKPDDVLKKTIQNKGYQALNIVNNNTKHYDLMNNHVEVFDDSLITKTKKSKLETLTSSLGTQQKKLAKVDNKTYSGIWKDDVQVSDYAAKKGSIQAKKDYFNLYLQQQPNGANATLYKKYLDDLDEFEKLGSEYESINVKIKKIESDIKKFTPKATGTITGEAFSQERKDAAYWFTDNNGSTRGADGVLRDKSGEVWRNANDYEKSAIYDYTSSYSKFNEPLRGIEYGTNVYKGVGNVDLEQIGVNYGGYARGQVKEEIDNMTAIIDKSSYDSDIWLQRGVDYSGTDKFFGINPNDFYLPEKELADKLVGTTPTEYAFMSTGVAKGKGFDDKSIIMNIYAPSGTKMMYAEPFSAFGNGDGRYWDGVSKQRTFGYESEMIIQRGTQFRVTKVEKNNGKIWVDMEVIGQGVN